MCASLIFLSTSLTSPFQVTDGFKVPVPTLFVFNIDVHNKNLLVLLLTAILCTI